MIPLSVFSVDLLTGNLLLLASVMIFAAVMVAKAGSKLGAPSLLLFLLLGMLVGPDVLGVRFDDLKLAESIGHFAMSVIMFTAGLETSYASSRSVLRQGVMLSTLGVLLTVLITGFALSLFGVPLLISFILAAILSSTDSASVFSVLRDKRMHLRENLSPLLELESGSNDPVALSLTVILVSFATSSDWLAKSPWVLAGTGALLLVLQLGIGLAVGFGVGYAARWVLGKLQSSNFALTAILVLSVGFFSNGIAQALNGNGLLASYITAISIGNTVRLANQRDINKFFDGITWIMQLMMFTLLGLMAHPSQMLPLVLPALALCIFMVFVARPASVFLCTLPIKGLSTRAKTLVSWVGIKGAGPILFALYAMVHGVDHAQEIFNFVFLFSVFSLLIQGGSISWMAGKLHLSYEADPTAETFGIEVPEEMGMMRDHIVTEDDLINGATLRDIHLPHGIRIMMVRRAGRFLVPHGSMPLEVGDHLVIILGDTDD